jgi:hypothetical protein
LRIEVDKELEKLLGQIKVREPVIYGRGHVETVRFLANYYKQHKPLQELSEDLKLDLTHFLEDFNMNLERSLENVIPKALASTLMRILAFSEDAKQTLERSPGAQDRRHRVRSDTPNPDVTSADPGAAKR